MLSPTMALLCRAVVPVFIQAFRNHGNMEKLTLYKPCLSELLCFSPSFLLVSAALQLFCRFLNACQISSSIRRERNVAPYPPNRSISAGEIRRAPLFDVLPRASSVVCSGLGGVQQNPCGGKQKRMGLNSCNTQRGQPDFRLIVSLFRFYPYASHEVIQANIPL